MAKKEEISKTVLERTYVIPLSRKTLKVPPYKKANKAMKTIKEFISKHMKSSDVSVGKYLNLKVWEHGIKNPPHKVKVNAAKDDKGKVVVEIFGAPKEEPKVEEKKKRTKEEEKKPEEKAEEAKKVEKEEIKELQKEHLKHHAPKMPAKLKMQESHPTAPKSV